jgi:hypothetical protein
MPTYIHTYIHADRFDYLATLIAMKLSNIDLDMDMDAVDLVRLAFLAATGGVSMHPHLRQYA